MNSSLSGWSRLCYHYTNLLKSRALPLGYQAIIPLLNAAVRALPKVRLNQRRGQVYLIRVRICTLQLGRWTEFSILSGLSLPASTYSATALKRNRKATFPLLLHMVDELCSNPVFNELSARYSDQLICIIVPSNISMLYRHPTITC